MIWGECRLQSHLVRVIRHCSTVTVASALPMMTKDASMLQLCGVVAWLHVEFRVVPQVRGWPPEVCVYDMGAAAPHQQGWATVVETWYRY